MSLIAWWREIAIALLVLALMVVGSAWRSEVKASAEFRGGIVALGEAAKVEAKRVEAKQQKTLEDVSNAWSIALPAVRDGAVVAYIRRHPPVSVQPHPCVGSVPTAPDSSEIPDGAGSERMAATPDAGFIKACAKDALVISMWGKWAIQNHIPIAE